MCPGIKILLLVPHSIHDTLEPGFDDLVNALGGLTYIVTPVSQQLSAQVAGAYPQYSEKTLQFKNRSKDLQKVNDNICAKF